MIRAEAGFGTVLELSALVAFTPSVRGTEAAGKHCEFSTRNVLGAPCTRGSRFDAAPSAQVFSQPRGSKDLKRQRAHPALLGCKYAHQHCLTSRRGLCPSPADARTAQCEARADQTGRFVLSSPF